MRHAEVRIVGWRSSQQKSDYYLHCYYSATHSNAYELRNNIICKKLYTQKFIFETSTIYIPTNIFTKF